MLNRLIVFLLIVLLGLSSGVPGTDGAGPEPVTVLDAGIENKIPVGGIATIVLESNATTGFSWSLEPNEYIELVSDDYVAPDTALPGAPGAQVFVFRAVKEGSTEIVLRYRRSWEPGSASAQMISIRVVIG